MQSSSRPTADEVALYAAAMRCSLTSAAQELSAVPRNQLTRILQAIAVQHPQPGELLRDPIEDEAAVKQAFAIAEQEAEASLGEVLKEQMGYCHLFWAEKASILKVRFGIEWFSPAQMNPGVLFD